MSGSGSIRGMLRGFRKKFVRSLFIRAGESRVVAVIIPSAELNVTVVDSNRGVITCLVYGDLRPVGVAVRVAA